MNPEAKSKRLIHVALIQKNQPLPAYLFLREIDPHHYQWFEESNGKEIETTVMGNTIEEAIRLASRKWKSSSFRTLICGFRFTLPERDEHGGNALFHQMVASYSSMNGFYFDEELGGNCIVQNASLEARRLWAQLKSENRL